MHPRFRPIFSWLMIPILLLTLFITPQTAGVALAGPEVPQDIQAAGDHLVTNVSFSLDTPNILRTNQQLTINYDYSTTEATGVRIFVRPYTNGNPSPSYAAHPSPIYPTSATGKASGWFTITTGQEVVDEVQIQMLNAAQTTLLFEAYLPVYYLFSDAPHLVHSLSYRTDTPNVFGLSQDFTFSFSYITRQPGGVYIWGRPFTNGALSPNYSAHGSVVHPTGSGSDSGFYDITTGQVVVDQLRLQMWDTTQTTLLFEAFLPMYARHKSITNSVTSINLIPDTPNIFKYTDDINLNFTYNTNEAGGVRIFARPFSGASLSPSYAAHGSPIYPVGSGGATGSFRITSGGPLVVDKIRIQMWNAAQTKLLFEAFLPVHLLWAGAGPPPGPNMHVDALEVTQAIQDLNNSVQLVAGKRTYVRMHVASPVNTTHVFATLTGKRGTTTLSPVLNPGNPGGDITVRTTPDRGQINDSFWFELPASWITAGNLTLVAKLDPNNAKNDLVQANNTRSVTVTFLSTPPLRLRLMDVQYTVGANTYLAAGSHLDALESWLRRAYPISSLQVTRQTFVYPTSGLPNVDVLHGWLALSKLLRIIFSGEDGRVVYYGVVDDGGGFMRGKSAGIPSTIAAGPSGSGNWGWDFDGSYNDWYGGHEIGHTRGRSHAEFCGAGGGAPYPYSGGQISPALTGNTALYGFDITTRAIYPPSWKDVMTYCANEWVSDFTYEGIRSYLVSVGDQPQAPQVGATSFLAIMGSANLQDHSAVLQSVYLVNQENVLSLPQPGDWTIALVDGSNQDLATYPFAPDELTDPDPGTGIPAVIAEVVPWTAGTVRVEIRYNGQVVVSRTASGNAPTVALTAPANGAQVPPGPFQVTWTGQDKDGDALVYSILISLNNGQTWDTLATNLTGSSLGLNTNQLPGGPVLLRVIASDGFLSGQATSGQINLPLHAPLAQIATPSQNQVFFPTQLVTLQGSANDAEDGVLGDAALSWSSDVDGALGTGANLGTTELSTGTHVITLTATDSNGMTGTAQRTIVVTADTYQEVNNLDVAPVGVGAVALFGSAPVQYGVSLNTSGSTELNWTVAETIPWLTVSLASGQTPTTVQLTFNPAGLPVGSYNGTVTFTSAQAANSPVVLPVTFQVTGHTIHIPILSR